MSNRRISEFPSLSGLVVDEQDLLTLVHVFEVDPTLRNKKITFTEFKEYLNQYYPNGSGGTFSGNVIINGNLTVTGVSNFTTATVSNLATFSGVVVQNNLTATGTISGTTFTGTNTNSISGNFQALSGNTINAITVSGVSGVFQDLFAVNQIFGGNLTFSGNTSTLGSATIASGLTVTGVVSGGASGFVVQGPLIILP